MSTNSATLQHSVSARQLVPWWADVEAARQTALNAGEPCALILNVDSGAL